MTLGVVILHCASAMRNALRFYDMANDALVARPHNLFQPGNPGRPKGSKGTVSRQQQEFAAMVVGHRGTKEFKAYVEWLRKELMSGRLSPTIHQTLLHYLVGKPVERVEVADVTKDVSELTKEQLRDRALRLLEREVEIRAEENTLDGEIVEEQDAVLVPRDSEDE